MKDLHFAYDATGARWAFFQRDDGTWRIYLMEHPDLPENDDDDWPCVDVGEMPRGGIMRELIGKMAAAELARRPLAEERRREQAVLVERYYSLGREVAADE